MQIVVPMSGRGARFQAAGYADVKPLISVDGLPMVEHVTRMFPGPASWVFVCASDHLETTHLRQTLKQLKPQSTIVGIAPHKLGPVYAVMQGEQAIRDDLPTIVSYVDVSVFWSFERFRLKMQETRCDGCLIAYRGFHPNSLGPSVHAHIREQDGYLLEIGEKKHFTDNRMNEFASAGIYYFRTGALMKTYFREALDGSYRTNGEFYCSIPYNAMTRDGLKTYVYEVDEFQTWGTPDDVKEYSRWSEYFAKHTAWQPSQSCNTGTNLIPMAGTGRRFADKGYNVPKPCVPVDATSNSPRSMLQKSTDSLPPAKQWIAVCRDDLLKHDGFLSTIKHADKQFHVVPIGEPTEGQACTCLLARDRIDPLAPLLIASCDTSVVYDEAQYTALTAQPDVDSIVWTFCNHWHANYYPRQYGWLQTDEDGWVQQLSCKSPLHEDVRCDPFVIGIFWFRTAQLFFDAAEALIAQERRINNEFYVDATISVLLEQGRRIKAFSVDHYLSFGTPDDVRMYQYWDRYFRRAAHHPHGALARKAA